MDGKVSVIIPVYNRQDVVEECVHSILAQSYKNFEIILIDDGSSDRTVEVCRQMASEDARIRVLEQQHGGVSAARNLGLESAAGEFVFFIDSDDVIHPKLIETLVVAMATTKAPMGACRTINVAQQYWHELTTRIMSDTDPAKTECQSHTQALCTFFGNNAFFRVMGSTMLRRDFIGLTRFRSDLFIGEDYFFIYENLIKGADIVLIDEEWYFLRLHKKNSSWNYSFDAFYSRFRRRELIWKSETSFGRPEHAARQKQDALGVFLLCVNKKGTTKQDRKKMRATIKRYEKELLPALTPSQKAHYFLATRLPLLYRPGFLSALSNLKRKLRPQRQR